MIVADSLVFDPRVDVVERISINTSRSSALGPVTPAAGQSVHGAQQRQPETREVAGVRSGVAVLGPPGEIRAFDRLGRASTLHGGRVDHPQIVVTDASVGEQDTDQRRDGRGQFAGVACCSRTGRAGRGTSPAGPGARSAASAARWCPHSADITARVINSAPVTRAQSRSPAGTAHIRGG